MKEAVEKAVKELAGKITVNVKSDDALKYTQAALNLMHVLQVRAQTELTNKR